MPDGAIKLKLEPGFYKNGTEYQSAGRWADGDLVRWHNDGIKPINGWEAKVDVATGLPMAPLWSASGEAARSGIVVGDTLGGVDTYIGTNKKIYRISTSNVKTDVTPAGFTAKTQSASQASGYGMFRYGYGKYGTKRIGTAEAVPPVFSWGFAAWGDWPVACARGDDALKIFIKRTTDTLFVPITASPAGANDVIVTDERFMMTFGLPNDGKMIKWSNQEDFDVWAPAINNQAGSLRVAGAGKLIRAVKLLKQILVIGTSDAFSGQYIGPPYVYGFNRVGDKCGICGPNAIAVAETFAAWLGTKSFWMFDGVVQQLPCDVLDFLLLDMNLANRSKTSAFTVSDFSECWWLYQSIESTTDEPDSYVIYNYAKRKWYTGRLSRTMGLDSDPTRDVTMVAPSGYVYNHEITNADHGGRVPFIETGPLELANGERLLGLSYVFPDEKLSGSVKMQLQVRDLPNQLTFQKSEPLYTRDFDLLHPTSTQGIMGRDIRLRIYSSGMQPQWVLGDLRVVPIKGSSPGR